MGLGKEKQKMERRKEGKEETMEVEEGWEVSVGPVWFEGAEGLIRVKNVQVVFSGF